MTKTSIGVGLQGNLSPGQYKDIALTVDELGIDYITMFGDLMFQPPIPPLGDMAGVYFIAVAGIVAAFFGAQALSKTPKK